MHRSVVRDGSALWCGSTNWTLDSWSREENVIVTVDSTELARTYAKTFSQLWDRRHLENTGNFDTPAMTIGGAQVRPWFCPGRGRELAHQIAARIDRAQRRVRIASPVLTSAPVLSALAEVLDEQRVDATGVVDITQTEQALRQWHANDRVSWKAPILRARTRRAEVLGQALDAVRPRFGPRLHAREDQRDRRRRVRRLLQPLALR